MTKQEPNIPSIPALTKYRQQGCTLKALQESIRYGLEQKEKDLGKTFSRQLFQAVGSDEYRIRLSGQNELTAFLTLSLARVDKIDKPEKWLDILEHPEKWRAERFLKVVPLLNKAVQKLASHIPKTRNPSNEGSLRSAKVGSYDSTGITAGEASLSVATLEGDATVVGARFFFECVFLIENRPESVLSLLLNRDERMYRFLTQAGLDDGTISAWHGAITHVPHNVSPLQAQVLLNDAEDRWYSVTPIFSVAAASWMGRWRRETLQEQNITPIEGKRPLYSTEAVEYGGTNARNIAAVMMDCSGTQHHPKVLPPRIRRDGITQLLRQCYRPNSLIKPKTLRGKALSLLSSPYNNYNNEQITKILENHISALMEALLNDINMLRGLLDSEHAEALLFQSQFNAIPKSHRYLRFATGSASSADMQRIAQGIAVAWLGEHESFKGSGERYVKIKSLIQAYLQDYLTEHGS